MDNHIISDLRGGVRRLRKRPGFTSIAVITLALGLGANTAIFSVVNGLFLRPLPYRDDSHLVALGQSNRKSGVTPEGVSPANFFDWREQMKSFEAIAAAEQWGFTLTDYGEPEAIRGWVVTKAFFQILGTSALLGRTLLPDESERNPAQVVVLSYDLWQHRFGSDPQIIGRKVTLNTQPFTVVGVMPQEFQYPSEFYLHYPQSPAPLATFVVGTSGDPTVLLPAVKAKFRELNPNQAFLSVNTIEQLAETTTAYKRFNLLWLGAFALVALVLATVGLYGLISFSTTQRTQEIGVRMALGAQTGDVLRLVMREGVTLALMGVAVGLVTVAAASRLMKSLLFGVSPIDALTFASVAALLMLVALVACNLPAPSRKRGSISRFEVRVERIAALLKSCAIMLAT